jgi:hypothetical protein
VEFKNKA